MTLATDASHGGGRTPATMHWLLATQRGETFEGLIFRKTTLSSPPVGFTSTVWFAQPAADSWRSWQDGVARLRMQDPRACASRIRRCFRLPDCRRAPHASTPFSAVETDFGQTDFGHPYPTMAKPNFGQTDFGQNRLWPNEFDLYVKVFVLCCVVLCCVVLCGVKLLCSRYCGVSCVGVEFQGLVWTALPGTALSPGPPFWTALPLDRPSPGPPSFFTLSRRKIRSFLPFLGVFSLNFGGVFEGRDPHMCTFGLSGCRVKPRRPHQTGSWPGLSPDRTLAKRAHLRVPALQTPPKLAREDPQRGKNRTNFVSGEGKKSAKFRASHRLRAPTDFGPPPTSGPTSSGPHPSGPHFSGDCAPTLRGPTLRPPTLRAPWVCAPVLCMKKKQTIKNHKKKIKKKIQTIKNHKKNNFKKSKQLTQKIQTIKEQKNK